MPSSKAGKQRKAQAHAPAHAKRRMLSAHLSRELRGQYGVRSAKVCRGDTVVVLRGNADICGIEGKVLDIAVKENRVTVEGITVNQADGTAVARPIHTSNLMIVKLNLDDPWRKDALSKNKGAKK